jgi:hypothetical protein
MDEELTAADWADTSELDALLEIYRDPIEDYDHDDCFDDAEFIGMDDLPILGPHGRMSKYDHLMSMQSVDEAYYRIDARTRAKKPACDCVTGNCVDQFNKNEIKKVRAHLWQDRDESAVIVFLSKIIDGRKDQTDKVGGGTTGKKYVLNALLNKAPFFWYMVVLRALP